MRTKVYGRRGKLLVTTDVHGNLRDFERMEAIYDELCQADQLVYWLMLGDLVHGPGLQARSRRPELYDWPDASPEIVRRAICRTKDPNVDFILGNHDHAHIGGPRTRKFYPDEALELEKRMSRQDIDQMHAFFRGALLVAASENGVVYSHGVSEVGLPRERIDALDPGGAEPRDEQEELFLASILTSYGQPKEVSQAARRDWSRIFGFPIHVVVHGHDRDEEGYYVEHDDLLCPVVFGAPDAAKRVLIVDLERDVANAHELSHSLVHLYG